MELGVFAQVEQVVQVALTEQLFHLLHRRSGPVRVIEVELYLIRNQCHISYFETIIFHLVKKFRQLDRITKLIKRLSESKP